MPVALRQEIQNESGVLLKCLNLDLVSVIEHHPLVWGGLPCTLRVEMSLYSQQEPKRPSTRNLGKSLFLVKAVRYFT